MPESTPIRSQLHEDVEAICFDGGRMVGSPGHARARQHLVKRLHQVGCVPWEGGSFELPYRHEGVGFCNLAGCIPGRDRRLAPLLIGAHYDSVIAFPCADDNGAAVAIMLQLARLAGEAGGLERDLLVVIFDAEEPPWFFSEAMGSRQFYARHLAGRRDVHAALVMDLVGHDVCVPAALLGGAVAADAEGCLAELRPLLFVTGAESHPQVEQVVRGAGQPADLRVIATLNRYPGDMSDHGVFRIHGVPYVFFSCGMWQHYHMPTDTPDRLNYDKMAAITRYAWDLLRELDGCTLEGRTRSEQTHDTIELESTFLREALGRLHDPLLGWIGLQSVRTREDMDRVAQRLLSLGLG